MQQLSAQVVSESNGQPVAGAAIFSLNAAGNMVPIARASQDGSFDAIIPETSPSILVTAPGFAPSVQDAGMVQDAGSVALKEAPLQQDATLQIKNTSLSRVPAWVWVGGTAVLLVAITDDGDGKHSLGEAADYSKYIIPVGVVIAGYLLLKNFGLFGSSGSGQNNAAAAATIKQGTSATLNQLAKQGVNPTISAAQAASIANNIFYAGTHVTSSDSSGIATIFNSLGQCRNDADFYLVMQNFGTRQASDSGWTSCSLLNINCEAIDLDSFVTAVVNQANVPGLTLQDLNYQISHDAYGSPNGVTFQF